MSNALRRQAVSWMLQLAAAASGLSASAQEPAGAPETSFEQSAREAYAAGLDSFGRGAYAEAAGSFARADGLAASPNAKLMLGRCLRALDELPEAYRMLQDSVRAAESSDPVRYEKTAQAARAELQRLRSQLGLLTVYVHADSGPALLHVDGLPIPSSEWQTALPVRAGTVHVSLETGPGVIEHRSIEIGAGQRESLVIGSPPERAPAPAPAAAAPAPARRPPPEPPPPPQPSAAESNQTGVRTASYVAGGIGVVGLIAFGVLGSLSAVAFHELEEGCPVKSSCDPSLRSTAERGELEQTAANVSLVVGLTALATGAVLFVLSAPEVESPQLSLAAGPGGMRVQGAF